MTTQPARQADRPADYARLGLERRLIKPWEDGIRIDTKAPNLEWWYCDADLDDGTGLCMIFATKDGTRPHQPLGP
ncbi:MAG TPA: hydroxyneurosporene dehydrogenase, partial [Thermoleophilia bacterium]|nr:hydroxyneurosporene dehydrogenase [Thermoleophilia bacterium]